MDTAISEKILSLSINEKIELVEELWDDIFLSSKKIELTKLQKEILDERQELYVKNETECKSWNLIKKELLNAKKQL